MQKGSWSSYWGCAIIFLLTVLFSACGGGYGGNGGGGGGGGNPPGAPTGLTATAGAGKVDLSWTASSGATSYHIKRATVSGGPYTQMAVSTINAATDTGLTAGTAYYYVVSAVNSYGESANSSQASATPTAPNPPLTPAGLTATPGNGQVVLSWNASTGATSYTVSRSTTSGGPYSTQACSTASTSCTDTSVANGTTYYYVIAASNAGGSSSDSAEVSATPSSSIVDVTVTVNPSNTQQISPWIFGINAGTSGLPAATIQRLGGNRWTAYNWETNASNAGSDFNYQNDNYLSSSSIPGEAVRPTIASDIAGGMATLMTVQMQGLVSADENGPVSTTNAPDMTRFKTVIDKKSTVDATPFTTTPPTSDANVYMDEFAWAMDQKFPGEGIFGGSTATPTFVDLDNEPELWNSTHLEVQGATRITSTSYINKTIALAEALKDQFPNMVIFGPVHYGFMGIYSWQGELSATPTGTNWFADKYLQALNTESANYGKPVVDVYDFHWYPEDYDFNGTRITSMTSSSLTNAQMQLVVQAPRNLWDPTFSDPGNSNPWVNQTLGNSAIQILPRLKSKIASQFPSMKLSVSEYEAGGFNNIAGTVAQADELGVFATQGVFAAMFWPPSGTYDYALAGFRAYRNFDGANSNFGDTLLQSTSSNVANVVVYVSTDSSNPNRVVFVAINRASISQATNITGATLSGTAHFYQMTASSAQGQSPVAPVAIGTSPVSGSSLTVTLPAYSVTTIDVH